MYFCFFQSLTFTSQSLYWWKWFTLEGLLFNTSHYFVSHKYPTAFLFVLFQCYLLNQGVSIDTSKSAYCLALLHFTFVMWWNQHFLGACISLTWMSHLTHYQFRGHQWYFYNILSVQAKISLQHHIGIQNLCLAVLW